MKIAIMDDDKEFIEFLTLQIKEKSHELALIADVNGYTDPKEFLVGANKYELIFLDIEMPGIDGLELIEKINASKGNGELPLIVFITNRENYVHAALAKYPFSFMRKPYVKSEIRACISQAEKRINMIHGSGYSLRLKANNVVVDVKDILYIYKQGNYVVYKCVEQEYVERELIKEKAKELEAFGFIRIHEGFSVNIDHVKSLNANRTIMANGDELSISRKYKDSANHSYIELLARRIRRSSW